jgi:hypothetical protein
MVYLNREASEKSCLIRSGEKGRNEVRDLEELRETCWKYTQ